ncbi:TetR/AcrR family transcriptional regulator [Kitasatospora sp. NBC_01246]|uniref:TetR/AcrR family transcriptional regulator n=1 Tax=Kitasatospora sp. NBC_01246 TaxID=2903570 RepID=UPI002E363087|nr:TetR/AcrR family transcriptional regulator [Kitasatospora sp. NBC_01246]
MSTRETEPVTGAAQGAEACGASGAGTGTEPGAAPQPSPTSVDRKRQPSGDEARGRAMRAAISVIAEKGTAAVRMSDIAARAGMSTGHILYHFGKKDRLLLEVLAWSEADLGSRFERAADEAASPAEKLALFVRYYLPRHPGDERYALWTQVLAQCHDDAGRQVLTDLSDVWEERLEAVLREGRALGQFADVDPTEFVIRAVAMLNGLSGDVMFGRARWQHASAHAFALAALERELRPTGRA